jgi:hypothetical protein
VAKAPLSPVTIIERAMSNYVAAAIKPLISAEYKLTKMHYREEVGSCDIFVRFHSNHERGARISLFVTTPWGGDGGDRPAIMCTQLAERRTERALVGYNKVFELSDETFLEQCATMAIDFLRELEIIRS